MIITTIYKVIPIIIPIAHRKNPLNAMPIMRFQKSHRKKNCKSLVSTHNILIGTPGAKQLLLPESRPGASSILISGVKVFAKKFIEVKLKALKRY